MTIFVCRDNWGYKLAMISSDSAPTTQELEALGFDDESFVFREESESDWCECGDMDCNARTQNGGGKCVVKITRDEPSGVYFDKFQAIQYLRDHDESCNEWHEAGMWSIVKQILYSPDDNRWNEEDLKILLNKAAQY